ncbi:MAG: ATP phosphoribosyltransferase regulatory subunit [Halofilum sp. (in: g-proteobacteria)]|nr:ATP phosphoribosyltransferase regulatory subunit [Halofilum sp. (in: g-proteobacteria)]
MSRDPASEDRGGRWLLPEGIEEALPETAWRLERLRRRILELYDRWGYDLVIPPLIEYTDSLLVGVGHDLELDTFKLVDQLSGRTMGLRADMTPQVARIDAHRLGREGPVRLCYLGAVVHTRPGPFGGSRSPLQLGAELYGHRGLEADLEVLQLLLATLDCVEPPQPLVLDLGHVGIVHGVAAASGLDAADEAALFEALQRKSTPDLEARLDVLGLPPAVDAMWRALADLHGEREVIARARQELAPAGDAVGDALDHLAGLADAVARARPEVRLHFDLAEVRGYHYHTGVVFAVYLPGEGEEIARGGRYDGIGAVFGRARPATGFSTDLRRLAAFCADDDTWPGAIAAPTSDDPALAQRVAELRTAGERVIAMLPGQGPAPEALGCDRHLVERDGDWFVEEL